MSASDGREHGLDDAAPTDERGRGIQQMRALVDEVHVRESENGGTTVNLTKTLVVADVAPSR